MMKKLTIEQKEKIIEKWIHKHGAAGFDLKERNIVLYDGGVWCIKTKPIMLSKTHKLKKLPDGNFHVIFSKEKYQDETYEGLIGFEDVDETILYMESVRRLLKKLGYKTNHNH